MGEIWCLRRRHRRILGRTGQIGSTGVSLRWGGEVRKVQRKAKHVVLDRLSARGRSSCSSRLRETTCLLVGSAAGAQHSGGLLYVRQETEAKFRSNFDPRAIGLFKGCICPSSSKIFRPKVPSLASIGEHRAARPQTELSPATALTYSKILCWKLHLTNMSMLNVATQLRF
jgi:hypothetical protein